LLKRRPRLKKPQPRLSKKDLKRKPLRPPLLKLQKLPQKKLRLQRKPRKKLRQRE